MGGLCSQLPRLRRTQNHKQYPLQCSCYLGLQANCEMAQKDFPQQTSVRSRILIRSQHLDKCKFDTTAARFFLLTDLEYIGEEGADCLLKSAVVVSNPWNLDVGSVGLQRTWLGKEIYSRAMGSNMKRLIERHHDEVVKNPAMDFGKIWKVTYLHEFDREVQVSRTPPQLLYILEPVACFVVKGLGLAHKFLNLLGN